MKKRLLAYLLTITLFASNSITAFAMVNTNLYDGEDVISENQAFENNDLMLMSNGSISESDLYGTWEGTYIGYSGSTAVERTIKISIDNCSSTGIIEGIAEVNNGAIYFLDGNIDFSTGKISFQGTDFIKDPGNFSFAMYSGTLNTVTNAISGIVDDSEEKVFSLIRTSDNYDSYRINFGDIKKDWLGEYDGHHNGIVVRRNYEIHITSMDDNGTIKGKAIISPSDKSDSSYAANGSYVFQGSIDERRGKIALQGTEWTDYPLGYDNFTFVYLAGFIRDKGNAIDGVSEDGIWEMKAIDYDDVHVISGFTLGRDNNNYVHTNSSTWNGAGFVGTTDYSLGDSYYNKLTKNSSKSEKNKIKKTMKEKWGGSCYGIAATIGLLYEGYIDIGDLTSESASSYYTLPYPCNDSKFLNNINYYQLSQSLEDGGKKSAAISAAYNYGIFSGLVNWACDYDSVSVFLKKLISYTSNEHVSILGFSTWDGGHAVLVTGCDYDENNEEYVVQVYDENCISSATSKGAFSEMKIPKDFSSFTYKDANGDSITDKSFTSIYFLDWSKMGNVISGTPGVGNVNHVYIDFPMDKGFTITDSSGRYLSYDGKNVSGSMTVYGLNTVDSDNESRIVIETDSKSDMIVTDIGKSVDLEVYNGSDFLSVSGQHIEGASLSFDDGLIIKGNDYSFEAYISTDEDVDENESGLVSVSATAKDDVKISNNGEKVFVASEKEMENIETTTYAGTDTEKQKYEDSEKDLTVGVKPDNAGKKTATLKFAKSSISKVFGDADFTNILNKDTDGIITYTSTDSSIASVDSAGKVTIKKAGTTVITATSAESDLYEDATASYNLTVKKKEATLKFSKSSVVKTYGAKAFVDKLSKKTDGKVTYKSSNKKIATVDSSGKVTIKGIGKVKITAYAKAGTNYLAKSESYAIKVNPKGTNILSLKSKSKGFAVKLKKQVSKTDGYQIQYSTSNKFKKVNTVTIKKNTTVSKSVLKLKGKKKYFVRVRTYKTVSGKKYYSSWSKVKAVTTKK